MKKYLVLGLESSGTRIVSQLIAINLGVIDKADDWDIYNNDNVFNENFLVTHKSLPHGNRDNYIKIDQCREYDYIIIASRDFNASLISKINNHQPDKKSSFKEHSYGIKVIQDIISLIKDNVFIFSLESAFLIQDPYVENFLSKINIKYSKNIIFYNLNKQYMIGVDK